MNFKQNSLFTRNTGFDEEQADVQGGVLAVQPGTWKEKSLWGASLLPLM